MRGGALKRPRRRRIATEIIPQRKGFMYDRARDLYVKLPIMKFTPHAAVERCRSSQS